MNRGYVPPRQPKKQDFDFSSDHMELHPPGVKYKRQDGCSVIAMIGWVLCGLWAVASVLFIKSSNGVPAILSLMAAFVLAYAVDRVTSEK